MIQLIGVYVLSWIVKVPLFNWVSGLETPDYLEVLANRDAIACANRAVGSQHVYYMFETWRMIIYKPFFLSKLVLPCEARPQHQVSL